MEVTWCTFQYSVLQYLSHPVGIAITCTFSMPLAAISHLLHFELVYLPLFHLVRFDAAMHKRHSEESEVKTFSRKNKKRFVRILIDMFRSSLEIR